MRTYTDADKERVYAAYAVNASIRHTARQTGIPVSTVKGWIDNIPEDKQDDLVRCRTQKKLEFIESAWKIIGSSMQLVNKRIERATNQEGALDKMIALIEKGEEPQAFKRSLIAKLEELKIQNVRELSTLIGTIYDKAALASGDTTQNIGMDEITIRVLDDGD